MGQRTYEAATPPAATARKRGISIRAAYGRVRQRASSLIYLPALLIPALALLLIGVGWATHWGGVNFGDSLTSLRAVTIGPLAFGLIALFLVAERLRPAQRRSLVARGDRHDVLYTVLNLVVVLPLITALTLSLDVVVRRLAPWVILPRIGLVPRWGAILAIVVAMDACNWLVHLANHRIRLLWRFHELHHSQEDMNVLTVFRTHPLIHVSYVLAVIPALVLIANGELPTLLLVFYGGAVAFAHSNTNLGFGPLERVFVSPNYHRIHHRLVGPQDLNLGFTLTIWDQLSHRALFPTPETIRADTGLPRRPLKVEQQGARPHHLKVFAAQLLGPFRPLDEPVELPSIREPAPVPQADRDAGTETGCRRSNPTAPEMASDPLAPGR
ncbi:MAG TPA: sterol desaturase family protein [Flexivirga sp.]|uniref:sterol desaturase family protein n=1 Tax=Flexivirga sp. TaxID=1962927 RepID=UPI002C3C66F4|nr:sterol desaturase family protein [Flexivirga sp.]HWC21652.1 sterol desaturase family protein [Flexivirga sp.]